MRKTRYQSLDLRAPQCSYNTLMLIYRTLKNDDGDVDEEEEHQRIRERERDEHKRERER